METTTETKIKKAGRPKSKSPPIKDALADSKLAVKEPVKEAVKEPVKEPEKPMKEKKEKKVKPPAPDTKLKDSLKELSKVATANKKEINNINKKIDNIIKKIKD